MLTSEGELTVGGMQNKRGVAQSLPKFIPQIPFPNLNSPEGVVTFV